MMKLENSILKNINAKLTKLISTIVVDITTYLWLAYFTFILKGKVNGISNIPKSACILTMNHVSYLDFIISYSILRRKYRKKIVFIGKAKLLNNFLWKSYLIGTGSIIIDYSSRESFKDMLIAVKAHLKNGEIIGIFPEGTRSPNGRLQKAQEGIGHILFQMNVPIIPIGLLGFFEAWPRGKKYPGISKCTIQIGKPIYFNISQLDKKTGKSTITNTVMEAIAELTGDTYLYSNLHLEKPEYNNFEKKTTINEIRKHNSDSKNLILFDLDGTLIEGQTQKIFLGIMYKEGILSFWDYIKIYVWFISYKLGVTKDTQKVRVYAYKKLANQTVEKIERIIETHFSCFSNKIYPNSFNLINTFKKNGDEIFIISASIEPIVRKICNQFSINNYLCTKLEVDNDVFSGNISGIPLYGDEKIARIKNYIDNANKSYNMIYYYNDHVSDIGLMEFVDIPICVNPDFKLKNIAEKKKWEILYW